MDKSSVFVGGTIGSLIVIIAFAVLFVSPPESIKPEIAVSNGNSASVVGETIQSYSKSLSLIEIFEKSESGVVRVNVQRGEVDDVTGGLGSGFVFDKKGHVISLFTMFPSLDKFLISFVPFQNFGSLSISDTTSQTLSTVALISISTSIVAILNTHLFRIKYIRFQFCFK